MCALVASVVSLLAPLVVFCGLLEQPAATDIARQATHTSAARPRSRGARSSQDQRSRYKGRSVGLTILAMPGRVSLGGLGVIRGNDP